MIARWSYRPAQPGELAQAIAEAKAAARAAGLTDVDIDAELAAYNAERRDAPPTRMGDRDREPSDGA
ncbi:Hydroxymethylglutaryl-CoA reductase (plasmid) [Rhodovastum atsumiense]|uniref:Uncharacterized protein n=1 Tax=Rhodovastum atsumiense TaxID=504468 RepID=A0A5M6IK31_9PROT|nr:hypothetical protein [Rhodovastum atsumiense]KAA5608626.1 hypothetical protein F1189_28095 [Rhodovastum atsumiense]CAH2605990.1 Hydroxymethylglutaryl-CoA reductase [Rhodovastum atsumiense]